MKNDVRIQIEEGKEEKKIQINKKQEREKEGIKKEDSMLGEYALCLLIAGSQAARMDRW